MTVAAVDTSVAVPLVVDRHDHHAAVTSWARGQDLAMSGHAFAETYAVLTRLPGDLRLAPADATRLLRERFLPPLLLAARTMRRLPTVLAERGVAGGATYDALVALAAREHDVVLATRDARARPTYDAVGARTTVAG